MSKLHIKQLAGPLAGGKTPTGSIPVFDGNLVRWSNAATTGLQIPTGTTLQRPAGASATDGLLRFNTDLSKFEVRENGTWTNVVSGIKSFLDLTDAPKTYTGSTGKVLAVKADGSGLEYIDPTVTLDKIKGATPALAGNYVAVKPDGSGLQFAPFPLIGNLRAFKFRLNFGSQYLAQTNLVEDAPAGWTFTASSPTAGDTVKLSILTVTHPIGLPPISGIVYGYATQSDTYTGRPIGNASLGLTFQTPTMANTFVINGLVTASAGAATNTGSTYGYVYLWFYL